jgi:ubiquinone/menaquinone biosynthesis C-methylase UbiE
MTLMHTYYPESKFGDFTDIDGTIVFYTRVNALAEPSSVVLDLGCGRGEYVEDTARIRREIRVLKGKVKKVIGIDVDSAAQENPFIDEFHLLNSEQLPLEDNSIDLCICDCVVEHLENPESVFSELRRVIKDKGYFCMRTPNIWNYIAIISRLIPNKLHAKVLAIAQKERQEKDIFPTVYKCNSILKVKEMLKKYGFESVVYGYESEPRYLSFSGFTYWLGVMHQKFAPGFLRPVIFAFAQVHKEA